MSESKLPLDEAAACEKAFEEAFPSPPYDLGNYYEKRNKLDTFRKGWTAHRAHTEQPKDSAPKLSKAQRDAIHEWLDFSFQHPSDEALDAATESLASAIEGASAR